MKRDTILITAMQVFHGVEGLLRSIVQKIMLLQLFCTVHPSRLFTFSSSLHNSPWAAGCRVYDRHEYNYSILCQVSKSNVGPDSIGGGRREGRRRGSFIRGGRGRGRRVW